MSNLRVKVDFLAGTDLKEAIKETSELAKRMNVAYIEFRFNKAKFSISQYPNIEKAFSDYNEGKNVVVV